MTGARAVEAAGNRREKRSGQKKKERSTARTIENFFRRESRSQREEGRVRALSFERKREYGDAKGKVEIGEAGRTAATLTVASD